VVKISDIEFLKILINIRF